MSSLLFGNQLSVPALIHSTGAAKLSVEAAGGAVVSDGLRRLERVTQQGFERPWKEGLDTFHHGMIEHHISEPLFWSVYNS